MLQSLEAGKILQSFPKRYVMAKIHECWNRKKWISYFCIVGYYVNNFEPIPALPKDLARRDIIPLNDGRNSLNERAGM